MTDIELTDFQIGKPKRNTTIWFSILASIMFLPFKIFIFFIPFKKNYTEVHENWTIWIESGNREIHRKIFAETGFDGVIKFYKLKFKNNTLNDLVDKRCFGTFFFETNENIFLREFKSPNQWPKSFLTVINKSDNTINRIKIISASWTDWVIESINDKEFNIITHPADDYTKGIKVTTPNNVYNL
ncbi:hypothetical protein G5B37_03870 [Rasiella rasia]|uniref:Uncharacterized protein n=1 Tax=Rasiella rasia TaxID=2744027 RepID=A0A6G6GJJ9_9FLAO|nr:hypothetical protein [Rasiella rasia]QIE58729.1 hypothetical protein G5B37_03870 [Rasiella rasia]